MKTKEERIKDKEMIEEELAIIERLIMTMEGEKNYRSEVVKLFLTRDDDVSKTFRSILSHLLEKELEDYFQKLTQIADAHKAQNRDIYAEESN